MYAFIKKSGGWGEEVFLLLDAVLLLDVVLLLDGGPPQECTRVMILLCPCEFPSGVLSTSRFALLSQE